MQSAPFPPDEAARRALLESLDLLDTAPEPVFDRVTRLAARLLGVPIALFSLVDADRQWFKSRVGLAASGTSRADAFCAHTILGEQPLVVEDALADPRFHDNPLVTGEPHVRFYAGVPVRGVHGEAIGTLCAIDSRPRTLAPSDLQVLRDLADIVIEEVRAREGLVRARARLVESGARERASEDRLRSIFALASIGIALVAPDGAFAGVNPALCAMVGYTEAELLDLTFQDITWPEDLDADLLLLQRLRRREIERYQLEKRYVRKDGTAVWVDLNVSCKTGADGAIAYYVAMVKDIQAQKTAEQAILDLNAQLEERVRARTHELQNTNSMLTASVLQQRRAENTLREREAELRSVIENANDAYICLDERGAVMAWNREAERTFGWSAAEAMGRQLDDLIIPPEHAAAHRAGMARYLVTGRSALFDTRLELPGRRKDGSTLMLEVRIAALEVNGRRLFSAFLNDISERKETEARRDFEARHDLLTGLGNRRALLEQLPLAQKRGQRTGHALALLFIDLDGFKAVNDTWGHEAGDRLLAEVAERLTLAVRETDSVFRLAGDEFTVILENLGPDAPGGATAVAEKLVAAVAQPVDLAGGAAPAVARVGASIGIALHAPDATTDAAALIHMADRCMYEAKQAGRGQVRCAGAG
ncbi:PAS domain S-box protein [uncultured Massilia sp.]|uniref:sensor domain-containing diguanylate cyclase n=1 Tax=uncultured Massilia sp. TaxID=169973 RepID=UPI0025CF8404|nr:PAS domain S-box protein [uncultured Massilia sp.]